MLSECIHVHMYMYTLHMYIYMYMYMLIYNTEYVFEYMNLLSE